VKDFDRRKDQLVFDRSPEAVAFQVAGQHTEVVVNGAVVALLKGEDHINPERHALFGDFADFGI